MTLSPPAIEQSEALARELGQIPNVRRVSENVVEVRSRNKKTPDVWYAVTRGLDGSLVCSCPASFYTYLHCWHIDAAKEEFEMNATSMALTPVVVQPSVSLLPSRDELDVVERAAAMAFAGKVALPEELNTKEKVAAVMLYGLELGLKPMTSIRHLYIVKGKVSPSAELMAGLCMAKERDIAFHVEELNNERCTIRMVRPRRGVDGVYTVTWDDIVRAGLEKGNNAQYPQDRMRYHCMKRLCRMYGQDLLNNLDEGIVLPGIAENAPWRPTVVDPDDDLYNEGDVPDNVDRETGEVIEQGAQATEGSGGKAPEPAPSPTLATQEQQAAITDWSEQLKNLDDGKDRLLAVDKVRRETWPYAVGDGNRFSASKLTEADAARYIDVLREAYEGVKQGALV